MVLQLIHLWPWVLGYLAIGALLAGMMEATTATSMFFCVVFWPLLVFVFIGAVIREIFS